MNSFRVWTRRLPLLLLAAVALAVPATLAHQAVGRELSPEADEPALAQPAGPVRAASFEATLTARGAGLTAANVVTARGRINDGGDVEITVRVGETGPRFALLLTANSSYLQTGDTWQVLAATDFGPLLLAPSHRPPAPLCVRGGSALTRIVADPLTTLGGPTAGAFRSAGAETLDGIAVERYTGASDMGRVLMALADLIGTSGACTQMLAIDTLGRAGFSVAPLTPVPVELWLGRDNRFPYRVQATLRNDAGLELELNVRVTPSAEPFTITPPTGATPFR